MAMLIKDNIRLDYNLWMLLKYDTYKQGLMIILHK